MIPIRRICSICLFAWLAVPLAAEAAGLGGHPSGKKTDRAQYARLCERFESGDTTLTSDQYATVYYGFAAQSRYNGSLGYGEVDAMTLIEQDKPQEAFALCERILSKAPVSLQGHMMLLLAAGRQYPRSRPIGMRSGSTGCWTQFSEAATDTAFRRHSEC